MRCAFFMTLPAFLPGTIGLLHMQAIGVYPAPYLLLAACCVERHCQSAERCHFLALQGDAQLQRRSRRVTQDHTEGIEPYDEVCPLCHCCPHALALGIATVCHGDIAWPQGKMLAGCTGVDVADQHLEKLQGQQVHGDVEAMVGAWGSWGLKTAGINDHKAVPRRQRVDLGQRQHPP